MAAAPEAGGDHFPSEDLLTKGFSVHTDIEDGWQVDQFQLIIHKELEGQREIVGANEPTENAVRGIPHIHPHDAKAKPAQLRAELEDLRDLLYWVTSKGVDAGICEIEALVKLHGIDRSWMRGHP